MAQGVGPDRIPAQRRGSRQYRYRALPTTDGRTLVLRANGAIDLLAGDGTVVQSWSRDDPEWGAMAFRFGIRVQGRTIPPRGPDTGSAKPGF